MQPPTPTNKFKTGVRAGGEEIACQRKYVGGEDRYGRYSTTYRIESPQKVGRVFYPAGHAPAGSDTGLAYTARQLRQDTITATAKDDSPGICDWDKDGRPNCSVSVNPSSIDLADTGWTEPLIDGDASESNALRKGFDEARRILTNPKNQECLGLFKNLELYDLKSAEELLNRYEKNGWIKVGDRFPSHDKGRPVQKAFKSKDVAAVTTGGTYSFKNDDGLQISASGITINKNGAFFSPLHSTGKLVSLLPGSGFYGMSQDQIRAAIIIHELLHTIGAIPADGPDVDDTGRISNQNARLVQEKCFRN